MSVYWKLFLFFGCSLIGVWVLGLLARLSDPTPPMSDVQFLNILLPVAGTLIVLFCYLYYKGINVDDIKSFINKIKKMFNKNNK